MHPLEKKNIKYSLIRLMIDKDKAYYLKKQT